MHAPVSVVPQSESFTHSSLGVWQKYPNEPTGMPVRQYTSISTADGEQKPFPTTPQSPSVRQLPCRHAFAPPSDAARHWQTPELEPQSLSDPHAS